MRRKIVASTSSQTRVTGQETRFLNGKFFLPLSISTILGHVLISGSEFEPNLHYSKGYWGGVILNTLSVPVAKLAVEYQAEGDCKYGDGR